MGANRGGTLNIYVKQDVPAGAQLAEDFGFQCAVAVAINRGVFEEVSRLHALQEGARIEEIIIHAVLLARSRLARSAGNGTRHIWSSGEGLHAQGRFACARGCRDDDQHWAGALGRFRSGWGRVRHARRHSTFWACSRNFSNSAFSTTTSREIRLSLALDPMVLISRFISCARKSSVRP